MIDTTCILHAIGKGKKLKIHNTCRSAEHIIIEIGRKKRIIEIAKLFEAIKIVETENLGC